MRTELSQLEISAAEQLLAADGPLQIGDEGSLRKAETAVRQYEDKDFEFISRCEKLYTELGNAFLQRKDEVRAEFLKVEKRRTVFEGLKFWFYVAGSVLVIYGSLVEKAKSGEGNDVRYRS